MRARSHAIRYALTRRFAPPSPAQAGEGPPAPRRVAPAATLLIPHFEVDFAQGPAVARTTLFTVTNVTPQPQIAHVTIWSDWSYPVLDFNIFLTGYDVQAINLYDVIGRGIIAPERGTSNANTPGSRSLSNLTGNPNFLSTSGGTVRPRRSRCRLRRPSSPTSRPVSPRGIYSLCGTSRIGAPHTLAVGYVTVDVAATCSFTLPTEPTYYSTEILFDNVFIGDFEVVDPAQNFAQGETAIHIRAIPEGGAVGSVPGTNLPYTFYDRYTPTSNRRIDRRQPLPSVFAARYIQGGSSGFTTEFKIWREGVTGAAAACSSYINNRSLGVVEIVRFDERENPTTAAPQVIISPFSPGEILLPETSRIVSSSNSFPPLTSGDPGGWMYMNLNNNASAGSINPYSTSRASQNWVIVSMYAEGRYSVDFDAAWLGNGCSPAATAPTTAGGGPNPIRSAGNVTP